MLLVAAPAASAGTAYYTFHLVPALPRADAPFALRVVTPANMCVPLGSQLGVQRAGAVVRYQVFSSDGCFPNLPADDRTYAVPALGAGRYTFRSEVCGFQPTADSPDGCGRLEERSVAMFGAAGAPFTVPALSGAAAVLAMLAVLAGAWRARRRA